MSTRTSGARRILPSISRLPLTLRQKISLGICLVVVASVAILASIVSLTMARTVKAQIRRELIASRRSFEDVQHWRLQGLATMAVMAAETPALKAVVTTPGIDHATVLDSAQAAQRMLHSDVLFITDAQGTLLASVSEPQRVGDNLSGQPSVAGALRGETFQGLGIMQGQLCQLIACPFLFGQDVVGTLVIGVTLDRQRVESLAQVSGSHVAFIVPGHAVTSSSSGDLFTRLAPPLQPPSARQAGSIVTARVGQERFVVLTAPLGDAGIFYALARSLDEALQPYRRLAHGLLFVTCAILLVAVPVGLVLSRHITRPIRALVTGTQAVARGDLASRVTVTTTDELGQLAQAFNRMTESLQTTTVSRQYVEGILRSMLDALVVAGSTGTIELANPAACQLLGCAEEALLGQSVARFFPGDEETFRREGWDRLFANSSLRAADHEQTCLTNGGRRVPVLFSGGPLCDAEGRMRSMVCVFRDITERKQVERQRQEQAVALERSNAELLRQQRAMQSLLEDLQVSKAALEEQRTWLQTTNERLEQSYQELRTAHAQLMQAEKLESVGRLAAGVAHEVKNPLAIILMGVEYLSKAVKSRDTQVTMILGEIGQAVKRADAIIRGLLDFASSQDVAIQPTPMSTVIEAALQLVKHELAKSTIAVHTSLASGLPALPLDRQKMEQVFVNLFMNAIHAMPQGGTLTVSARLGRLAVPHDAGARGTDRLTDAADAVIVEVDDTGTGIPEDKLPKIFDPFFTTKPTGQGTGLGLTVTKKIVEMHGGTLHIGNRPAGGVRATITLREQGRS